MSKFKEDFVYFTELIESGTPFAYARYADGEVGLMNGSEINYASQAYQVDKWKSPAGITKVGTELLETLNHTEDNYYYAISAHSDSVNDFNFLRSRIKTNNITFANLWINSNYQSMKSFYMNLKRDVYLICNHEANPSNFPFKIVEFFPFPDNCIEYWEMYGDDYISQLVEYTSQVNNQTFFVSTGPVSEILIHRMYESNPNNQYIDVGSSIDEFVHGKMTRPYMNPNSQYANDISEFKEWKLA